MTGSVSTTHFLIACAVWAVVFTLAFGLCWQDASEADRREGPKRKG